MLITQYLKEGCVLLSRGMCYCQPFCFAFTMPCLAIRMKTKGLAIAYQIPCLPMVFENKTSQNFIAHQLQLLIIFQANIFTSEEVIQKNDMIFKTSFTILLLKVQPFEKKLSLKISLLFTFGKQVPFFMLPVLFLKLYEIV